MALILVTPEIREQILTELKRYAQEELDLLELSGMTDSLLYDMYFEDMPIGVANGDTGTSDEYIAEIDPLQVLDDAEDYLNYLIRTNRKISSN